MATIAELKNDFERLIEIGALSHAYLFYGFGDGKEEVMEALARRVEAGAWEDRKEVLFERAAIAGEETGINEARAAIQFLWQKPARGSRRTLIVPRAERLTIHAEQALLKVAEDPPAHAFLLFGAADPSVLIAPLASRLQKLFVASSEPTASADDVARFKQFLRTAGKARKDFLKKLVENDAAMEGFVAAAFAHLHKDPVRQCGTLKELLNRWSLIRRFNVNKRLQLEAALLEVR